MAKKKAAKKVKVNEKKPSPVVEPDKEQNFDFGGLPDRNLKKSLGCG